jgi:two-component system, cell cycle sensor histidine kinase and response regulator CckA
MANRADRAGLTLQLLLAAVSAAALMSGFEVCKQLFFPRVSIWQSHLATICFTTLLAVLAAYFIGRKLATLNRRLQHDLEQGKQIAFALEESEERYRSLFERNKAGVFRSTLAGRFLDCNQAFASMFGYTREELLQLPAHVLYVGGKAERAERFAELTKTRQFKDVETCYRHKSGRLVWAIQNVTLVKDREGNDVSEGTVVDITERHALQERLRQAEKMEAVGRLAGGIAHDFNNLLTIIIGYSSQVRDHVKRDDEMLEPVTRIKDAANQAAALIRQLLAFSRKQVLQVRTVNLNALVMNMESMLRRLIGADIRLIARPAAALGLVKADPSQMEQVIMNLVVNARDAMPNGGTLTLETANIDLDENHAAAHVGVIPGPYVMLAVSDTGMGMTPETQAQIFEPFFTTKELGRGTGLGLSTVYGIVNQSGGHIWVYSEPGHGTTFKLYLPRTEAEPESVAIVNAAMPNARSNETILLVEDNPQVRELVRSTLATAGYSVLASADAKAALAVLEQRAKDIRLLLTDLIMPEINGRELARQITAINPDIKVLFMSGYTENTIDQHGVLNPDANFLQKPFTPASLAAKVREVLDGSAKSS